MPWTHMAHPVHLGAAQELKVLVLELSQALLEPRERTLFNEPEFS